MKSKTPDIHKRMSDIDISLMLIISPSGHYQRGNFSKRLNNRMNETCTNDWNQMFHDTLHSKFSLKDICLYYHMSINAYLFLLDYLDIDYNRITKIDYRLNEYDEHLIHPPMADPQIDGRKYSVKNTNEFDIYPHSPSSDIISDILSKNKSAAINFYFSITDRNITSNDTLTGLHVVTLLLLASEFHVVLDLCKDYSIKVKTLSIISDKNNTQAEFCSEPDVMYPTKTGIIRRRVRPDGEVDYVVDIPELDTTYEGGDYTYVFIVSTLTQQQTSTSLTVILKFPIEILYFVMFV